ncbi:CRISPR type IV/AFERR-associated protein Csf3 [Thermanaeromonas toyohensis ToBE]|uniref:CRISPR type IV/AFERR-associated protein Csf3 n=1 Tax=Thermanaeromonas toyohensis ToBE TaxID=698762 RepID=A0A1W1VSL5_9FIRM|nr:hypothetical protein [Thermanaeromonas toyohensis]SMB96091.1 CRISPR type IV/AFERR-associated protein Csf3 [Thermanaeromonas toyohensis ToBE]
MRPLVIDMYLASPLALPYKKPVYPLHFDSLVVAALALEQRSYYRAFAGDGFDPENDVFSPGRNPDVPLAVLEKNGIKIYCASAAIVPDASNVSALRVSWVKTAPERALIDAAKGIYDNVWKEPRPGSYLCLCVPRVRFFCVGDSKRLKDLLSLIRGVGVGRQAGFGQIEAVHIQPAPSGADPEAWGVLWRGTPVRYIPVGMYPDGAAKGWRRVCAAARPPYWHPAMRELCWAPSGILLAPECATLYLER